MSFSVLIIALKGSSSSGHHGHDGRKGNKGGSAPRSADIIKLHKQPKLHNLMKKLRKQIIINE